MRFSHFILIVCWGLVTACNSADPHFSLEDTLTQELMPLQGLTYPVGLEIKYPFLILENGKRTDSLYHIYDLASQELKSAFGVTGQGPDEFISTQLYQTPFSDIFIGDIDKKLVYRFGINEKGEPVSKGTKQPRYIYGTSNAAFINDSLYVLDAMHLDPLSLIHI